MSRGYETRDVNFRPVLWASLAGTVVVIASFVGMWLLYVSLNAREERESAPAHALAEVYGRKAPPAPQLQQDPVADLRAMRQENLDILTTYDWVDRSTGAVRIPIERAMELARERGFAMRADRGLKGSPDPRFEAYLRRQNEAPESVPPTEPRRKRERKRGGP